MAILPRQGRSVSDPRRALPERAWPAEALAEGREAGTLHFEGTPRSQAEVFLSGVAGAVLLARAHQDQDVAWYCAVAHQHLAQLGLGGRVDAVTHAWPPSGRFSGLAQALEFRAGIGQEDFAGRDQSRHPLP